MEHLGLVDFIRSYAFWRDAMIAGVVTGVACGFLGIYVVVRRMVFLSAMLSQVSAASVAISFYLGGVSLLPHSPGVSFCLSLLVTFAVAIVFAGGGSFERVSREGVIGFIYLAAGAATLLIASRLREDVYDISSVLFGTAAVADAGDVLRVSIASGLALALQAFLFKDFVFASFDPEGAKLARLPERLLSVVLLLSIAAVISVSTQAMGALPVFGLTVLPPLAALTLTERLLPAFVLSSLIGAGSAALGYFLSFVFSLPTGAAITALASAVFLIGLASRLSRS